MRAKTENSNSSIPMTPGLGQHAYESSAGLTATRIFSQSQRPGNDHQTSAQRRSSTGGVSGFGSTWGGGLSVNAGLSTNQLSNAPKVSPWQPQKKPSTSSATCRASTGDLQSLTLPQCAQPQRWGNSTPEARMGNVKLTSAGCCLPHPAKDGQGEDAHFFTDRAIGVADGVGGWAAHGIDAGEYARQLMHQMQQAVNDGTTDPVEAMWKGYNTVSTLGSSTCLLIVLDRDTGEIESANLGDSGFLHIRGSEVSDRAEIGQHYFNCPFQLGSHSGDMPSDALRQEAKAIVGDVYVCGSDGLFDNLFDTEIVSQVNKFGDNLAAAASAIAHLAQKAAGNMHRQGPFAQEANANGIAFQGGKLDDITCVVSKVVPADA